MKHNLINKFLGLSTKKNDGPSASRGKWSFPTLLRYILLQLPPLFLVIAIMILLKWKAGIPEWLIWLVAAILLAKDIVLYPLVWKSYAPQNPGFIKNMIGAPGIAREKIDPTGYVEVRGELWEAECRNGGSLENETEIRVIDVKGLKLVVEPFRN